MELENPDIDPRFLFVNIGYNLRPMEIQAAFGLEQLSRLPAMNESRRENVNRIRNAFVGHPDWRSQMDFLNRPGFCDCCGYWLTASRAVGF